MHNAKELFNKRKLSTNHDVSKDWHRWCRLCAKADVQNINIYRNDENAVKNIGNMKHDELRLSIAVSKYFSVDIQRDDQLPNRLCTECLSLVIYLIKFNNSISKVQQMYVEFKNIPDNAELDVPALRIKFGVLEDERLHGLVHNSFGDMHSCGAAEPTIKDYNGENFIKENFTESMSPEQQTEIISMENSINIKTKIDDVMSGFENVEDECKDPFASDIEVNNSDDENFTKTLNENIVTWRKTRSKSRKGNIKSNSGSLVDATGLESTEYKYFCSKCPLRFQRIGNYRVHLNKKHGNTGYIPPFSCPDCSRSFKSEFFLKRHIKTHQPLSDKELYPCPLCERKFKAKDYVSTHEGVRSFICEECGEAIRTQDALRQHRLTHTDFAPFICEICKKGFKDRARLKKHLEIHSSTKYTCGECGLKLNSRTTMNQHKLVHSDEMRHKCDYCGRAFKRSKSLKSHLLLHSGIKPYCCEFCERTFTSGSNCRLHMKKTHPNEFTELEASGEKKYTQNIPKLAVLKSVVQTGVDLIPVASKQSGNFASGKKGKAQNDPANCPEITGTTETQSSLDDNAKNTVTY